MLISAIVSRVNQLLAGEKVPYHKLEIHLDAVIDDINTKLNTTFPAFSELPGATEYTAFPDRWIRMVVCMGTAQKFFNTDEEGLGAAPAYALEYDKNLFLMCRDYFSSVPEEYRANTDGIEGTILLARDTEDGSGGLTINGANYHF